MVLKIAGKNDRYTYRVTWSEEDNEYVGLCAEFPGTGFLRGWVRSGRRDPARGMCGA